jgi:methylglutaconyl-CoA hydratase
MLHRVLCTHFRIATSILQRTFVSFTKPTVGVAELVLARHEGKNALSDNMLLSLSNAVEEARNDNTVRVLIIHSSVDKVFCAGADLKERLTMTTDQVGPFVGRLRDAFTAVASLPFPTIAAIDGAALGGGLELALACDIRVASQKAILGLPETNLAIIPGAGGTQRLPRLIGVAQAKYLIFTGARLSSQEALRVGLISEAVTADSCLSRVRDIAASIVDKGPIGLKAAKLAIDGGMDRSLSEGLKHEKDCYNLVLHSEDRVEGLRAFVEKRKPNYSGK